MALIPDRADQVRLLRGDYSVEKLLPTSQAGKEHKAFQVCGKGGGKQQHVVLGKHTSLRVAAGGSVWKEVYV